MPEPTALRSAIPEPALPSAGEAVQQKARARRKRAMTEVMRED